MAIPTGFSGGKHAAGTLAELQENIDMLFSSLPELCGFSVRIRDQLILSDVALYPALPTEDARQVFDEIWQTLASILEEQPHLRRLLRERTFARSLH